MFKCLYLQGPNSFYLKRKCWNFFFYLFSAFYENCSIWLTTCVYLSHEFRYFTYIIWFVYLPKFRLSFPRCSSSSYLFITFSCISWEICCTIPIQSMLFPFHFLLSSFFHYLLDVLTYFFKLLPQETHLYI